MDSDHSVTVRYEDVSDALTKHLPELRSRYEVELKWWGDERPGPHVVYGDILNPYIDRLLQSREEAALHRVFNFIELLSSSGDLRVQELVTVTVCEHLGDDEARLHQARRFMGSATLKHCDDIERFWRK